MTRLLLALALALVTACCATVPEPFDPKAATVRLEFDDGGSCSGTATAPNELTTATHCLSGRLLTVNGERVTLLHSRKVGADITLLYVDRRSRVWAYWRTTPPAQQERIHWFGNPLTIADQYREGYITGQHGEDWLADAEVGPGDSGAGVFDSQGRLVGVVSGYLYARHDPFRLAIIVRRRE